MGDLRASVVTSPVLWAALAHVIPLTLASLTGGLMNTAFPHLVLAASAVPIVIVFCVTTWHFFNRRRIAAGLLGLIIVIPAAMLWATSARRFASLETRAISAFMFDHVLHRDGAEAVRIAGDGWRGLNAGVGRLW